MEKLSNALIAFVEQNKGFAIGIVVIAVAMVGLGFIIPIEETKRFAKNHILHLVIGVAILLSAIAIANGLFDSFQ